MKFCNFFFLALFFLQGCGAIVNGTEQKVKLHITNGEKHTVFLNGREIRNFNGEIIIPKDADDNFLTVRSPGYTEVTQYFSREINPVVFTGDMLWLIGAPIAVAIDFCTGGVYDIKPDNIRIVLRRKE